MRSFDDPKPARDVRKPVTLFLRPTLKTAVDRQRGKLTRSEWIERAIEAKLAREKTDA